MKKNFWLSMGVLRAKRRGRKMIQWGRNFHPKPFRSQQIALNRQSTGTGEHSLIPPESKVQNKRGYHKTEASKKEEQKNSHGKHKDGEAGNLNQSTKSIIGELTKAT